jgi:hypothetical protein
MIMAGALLIGAFVAYGFIKAGYEETLERRLKTYAATSAAGFGPYGLRQVQGNDDELADRYRNRLRAAQEFSGVRRVAVLHRDGTLLIDTDDTPPGGRDYGFATDANELERCFEDGPLTTIEYEDAEGRMYRNGFAPVLDNDGVPTEYAVAVELEADYTDRLDAVAMTMALTVAGVFIVTLASALLLAGAWRRMVGDLARQRRLAEQAQFSAGMAGCRSRR